MRRSSLVTALLALLLCLPALAQNSGITIYQPALTTGNVTSNSSTVSAAVVGYGSATVSIHGTHAGINFIFELSDDSTNGSNGTWYTSTCSRTDITLWQATSGIITSNASWMWDCAVWGATYLRVRATAYTSGTGVVNISPSAAFIEPASTVGIDPSADPCGSPSAVKKSASIAFSSATTTEVIAGVANQKIYVCQVYFTMSSGTTPTIVWKAGTSTCSAAVQTFTGVMALPTTSGSIVDHGGGPFSLFVANAGSGFCYTTAGTTPTGNGFLVYVQQ